MAINNDNSIEKMIGAMYRGRDIASNYANHAVSKPINEKVNKINQNIKKIAEIRIKAFNTGHYDASIVKKCVEEIEIDLSYVAANVKCCPSMYVTPPLIGTQIKLSEYPEKVIDILNNMFKK